jgi:protein-S-isoprenylcysteine O-methyltransferase Ste14
MTRDSARIPAFGPRGEGWVLLQAILLGWVVVAGFLGAGWPRDLRVPILALAIVAGAAGLWLTVSAVATLGRSASPFPKPPATSKLKQSGVYLLVRHPIYGGILLLSAAWSLLRSPWALIPAGALAIALVLKSRLEEQWLIDRHPGYAGYRQRVRRRFVPFLW